MKEALPKLKLKTLKASPSATSSPESAAGLSPCVSPECQTISDAGQALHHASHSARQVISSVSLTKDTSHQRLCVSSVSASLQSSLASKLQQQLQSTGSTIYSLSWKTKATPVGRLYCQRVASVPRTKETDCSLVLSSWQTTTVEDAGREGSLEQWMQYHNMGRTTCCRLRNEIHTVAWPTPRAVDGEKNSRTVGGALRELARGKLSCVPGVTSLVTPLRITASGQMLTGSAAGMESSGQLNPAHSRWLMGFPPEWDDCAVMAMQSYQKSLPNSSVLSWRPLTMRLRAKK